MIVWAQSEYREEVNELLRKYESSINILCGDYPDEDKQLNFSQLSFLFSRRDALVFNFIEEKARPSYTVEEEVDMSLRNFSSFLYSTYENTTIDLDISNSRISTTTLGGSDIQVNIIQNAENYKLSKYLGFARSSLVFYLSIHNTGQRRSLKIDRILNLRGDFDHDTFDDTTGEDNCPRQYGKGPGGCPDTDGDGVPDHLDQCPDEYGYPPTGCQDKDQDGVLDSYDQCPDVAGQLLEHTHPNFASCNGCPDFDGDDFCDDIDQCPKIFGDTWAAGCPDGDQDGILDPDDRCPGLRGVSSSNKACNGCPDQDGDGLCDKEDTCSEIPGDPNTLGCPDKDGDLVPDIYDQCPDTFGIKLTQPSPVFKACHGCPDFDGDGYCDSNDDCPELPYSNNGGCPPPEAHSKFELGLMAGWSLPFGAFSRDQLFVDTTSSWQRVGLADGGLGLEISLHYNFSSTFAVGMQLGYLEVPLDQGALQSNIKLALLNWNIDYATVEVSTAGYRLLPLFVGPEFGIFRGSAVWGIKLAPRFGVAFMRPNTSLVDLFVDYSGDGLQFQTETVNLNPENKPVWMIRGDVEVRFLPSIPDLKRNVSLVGRTGLLLGKSNLEHPPILLDNIPEPISFEDQFFALFWVQLGLMIHIDRN